MIETARLPKTFQALQANLPDGYTVSDRILEASIILDRDGSNYTASLGGIRRSKGERLLLAAPTPDHLWVLDGSVFRPLPQDAGKLFRLALDGGDPAQLKYQKALSLLRNHPDLISVEATPKFASSGNSESATYPGEFQVEGLKAELYPYQARGIQWMWERLGRSGGVILADEMGLGKTLQVIALLVMGRSKSLGPALILCPTSLIANWRREIAKFASEISVLIHQGQNRTGLFRDLQHSDVVIATYDTAVNDITLLTSFEWAWVICDEAQAIKNPDSLRRTAVARIPRARSIAITGTPVENTLLDLWSLSDFVLPAVLESRSSFEAQFPDDIDSANRLAQLTDPFILKRRVADVAADLPPRLDIDVPLSLTEELAQKYKEVRAETIKKYPVAGDLVATLKLQLFCAHPWLVTLSEGDPDEASIKKQSTPDLMTPKLERASSLLRELFASGEKVLVFALFNRCADLLFETCGGFKEEFFWSTINGSTPQSERQEIIDKFSGFDGPGCLVLNPKAAGAGLNITAATTVIHFTPVWNPALEAQASARAHRRGQSRPVTIYRLFYEDTVEQVMIDRSTWKNQLGHEAIPVSTRDAADLARALMIEPEGV